MNEFKAVELGYARPNEDNHEWREGYHVVYEDGYHSWCPLSVFEKANKPADSYIDRMYIEAEELKERIEKASTAIDTSNSPVCSFNNRILLKSQIALMKLYLEILEERIRLAILTASAV